MLAAGDATAPGVDEQPAAPPLLSVVVAVSHPVETLPQCVGSILAATAQLRTEILIVGCLDADEVHRACGGSVRLVRTPPDALVPSLWRHGLHAARGVYVGFLTAHSVIAPTWGDEMLRAFESADVSGAGGAFLLHPEVSTTAGGLFFLRFSKYLSDRWMPGRLAGDIAGDNAVYRRDHVIDPDVCPADGFWEVEVHRELRRRGRQLMAVAGADVTIVGSGRLVTHLRERFRHGRRFARWRARTAAMKARVILAAPLVPLLLLSRVLGRVWPVPRYRRRLLFDTPCLLLVAIAWAAGEAAGALPLPSNRWPR